VDKTKLFQNTKRKDKGRDVGNSQKKEETLFLLLHTT